MKKQKGFSTAGAVAVTFLVAIVMVVVLAILNYIEAFDKGVGYENNIKAAWENNENLLGQFKLKLTDAVSTSEMSAEQVTTLIEAANKSRYGEQGNQASWTWLKEMNLPLDPTLNQKVMQIIEASRNDFQAAQTQMVETKRSYQTALDKNYPLGEGWWLKLAGFPKIDLAKYYIISSDGAREAFATGIDKQVNFGLNGEAPSQPTTVPITRGAQPAPLPAK